MLQSLFKIKIRNFLLVGSLFFVIACHKHYVRELPIIDEKRTISKKIATVGFYPYYYSSSRSGRTTTTTALLDYRNPTTKLVPIGKSLDEIPSNGINATVPPNKVKEFVKNYLNQVKRSGATEISKMVEVKGEGDAATFHLKNRDVDYYIVGIHGPAFDEEGKLSNLGKMLLTGHIFMFSLGTSPLWSTSPADTEIQVYDKNLNLVSQKVYKSRYTRLTAWWGNETEGNINKTVPEFSPKLYEPDLRDFYNELPSLLTAPK